jgi:hypothetical protein
MAQVIKSAYTVLSNNPITNYIGNQTPLMALKYILPAWFVNWVGKNKQRIIKVYGCSFGYLTSVELEPKISDKFTGQFITVHSNIAHNDTVSLREIYSVGDRATDELLQRQSSNPNLGNYMMTVNNFYTPKIYDLSEMNVSEIELWFNDAHGQQIPIRKVYGLPLQGIEYDQAVFKLELELATIQN